MMTALSTRDATDTGLQRSAALMRALGPAANAVWAALSPAEAGTLTEAMDNLPISQQQENEASARFVSDLQSHKAAPTSFWAAFSTRDGQTNAAALQSESPQVIAVILSRMTPESAAATVQALPKPIATEALRRLLHLGDIHPNALTAIEAALTSRLGAHSPDTQATGTERVARIFDSLGSGGDHALLATLDSQDPGVGERIRALMFTFDDLATLGPASLQTILAGIDRGALILALKGAKPETAAAFYNNMTARAVELLTSEIETSGPVRRRDIDAARAEIVALARTLIKRGDILSDNGADDEIIE